MFQFNLKKTTGDDEVSSEPTPSVAIGPDLSLEPKQYTKAARPWITWFLVEPDSQVLLDSLLKGSKISIQISAVDGTDDVSLDVNINDPFPGEHAMFETCSSYHQS